MFTYLNQHPLVPAIIAGVAAVVIVALNPGEVWAWIIGVLAVAWLVITVRR